MGFFDLFKKKAPETSASATAPPPSHPVEVKKQSVPTYIAPNTTKEKLDIVIPEMKDGSPLKYTYNVKINLTDEVALRRHHELEDWYFDPVIIDGEIHLLLGEDDIGTLADRVDMLIDWITREDPYIICFKNLSETDGATAFLAFYRDKRKGNEWRDQTVVGLTAYKSNARQEIIMFLHEGEEVDLEENEEGTGVNVVSGGDVIGKLPAKYAKRYEKEGAYAAFVEKIESDDGGSNLDFKDQPFIRIFWTTRAQ